MHFTYEPKPSDSQLMQGDVIRKTDEICALLEQYYPYWAKNQDYTHLMVITQTCDLVRRDQKPCKATCINVAAVKPLETVLMLQTQRYRHTDFERFGRVCPIDEREEFLRFLEKLMNNNQSDYFYLHEEPGPRDEPERCLFPDSCAFLRISVAVRREHYHRLLEGKILELRESFQAKLGLLVGTIYSRVGTEDWVPNACTEDEFREILERTADEASHWLEGPSIRRLARAWSKEGKDPAEAERTVLNERAKHNQLTRKQGIVESVIEALLQERLIEGNRVNSVRQVLFRADQIRKLK